MSGSISADQLRALIERIERLSEEKDGIAEDIKEVYAEARSSGFDTKIIRKIVALRKRDEQERREEQAILDTYMEALGMLADTPLGQSAIRAAENLRKMARRDGVSLSIQTAGHEPVRIA